MIDSSLLVKLVILPVQVTLFLLTIAILLGRRVPRRFALAVSAAGVLSFVLREAVLLVNGGLTGTDFKVFWEAARMLRDGIDPYTVLQQFSLPFPYPPTSVAIFAIFGAMPFWPAFMVWEVFNVLASLALVPLAARVLEPSEKGWRQSVARPEVWVLTGLVVLSHPVSTTMELGQTSIFIALCLVLSVLARSRNRPYLAGLLLPLTTIKPQTTLPFLILFLRLRIDQNLGRASRRDDRHVPCRDPARGFSARPRG